MTRTAPAAKDAAATTYHADTPLARMTTHGAASLANAELLALVAYPTQAPFAALELARQQLTQYGSVSALAASDCTPLRLRAALELARRSLRESLEVRGSLNSPREVRDYLRLILGRTDREVFVALFLDAQHRVIATDELFHGTLTQTSVYPREVVKAALARNAAAVIFAHNHPSGVAEPSHADELLTRSLKSALGLVDVQVLDHFIVAGGRVMSFAERGLL